MKDYRIERIPESTLDGKIIDIGYKLFLIGSDGKEHQMLYGGLNELIDYIKTIHADHIGETV